MKPRIRLGRLVGRERRGDRAQQLGVLRFDELFMPVRDGKGKGDDEREEYAGVDEIGEGEEGGELLVVGFVVFGRGDRGLLVAASHD